jgi:hypothetical protein
MRIKLSCLALLASLCLPLRLAAAPDSAPDALTPDGGRYYGPLVDGKLHGTGRLEWTNGARYQGEFADGTFSGRGQMHHANGDSYEGEFREGSMSGQGVYRTKDGSTYIGTFALGHFEGQGRFESSDGDIYEGTFKNGALEGKGRLTQSEAEYRGQFKHWRYSGKGEIAFKDGTRYRGEFVNGRYHGEGRFEKPGGEVYEGEFDAGQFSGEGVYAHESGVRHEGRFVNWRPHGPGRFTDPQGGVYQGTFVDGQLNGEGRYAAKDGTLYEGTFESWQYHGRGRLELPNGDVYRGGFARGFYEGEGTLTYAKPRRDGRATETGTWRYGELAPEKEQAGGSLLDAEAALYAQRRLLDEALASLAPAEAGRINMYLLAVAGDGSQEVFRREVEFVRDQFARSYGTQGRAITLVNSRTTMSSAPMATVTSIREALAAIAARMDADRDVLFLFLSSHGSKKHEFQLDQNHMDLRELSAGELGALLKESGIRWKVVVVSACYSGGFIDPIKDDHTLVITAARHDRRSFGCSDENDFTYFGEAFFKDALPRSGSFQEAFASAQRAVHERELADRSSDKETDPEHFSLPQMHSAEPIEKHLQRWWAEIDTSPASHTAGSR